jgi:hypothetical protein
MEVKLLYDSRGMVSATFAVFAGRYGSTGVTDNIKAASRSKIATVWEGYWEGTSSIET